MKHYTAYCEQQVELTGRSKPYLIIGKKFQNEGGESCVDAHKEIGTNQRDVGRAWDLE